MMRVYIASPYSNGDTPEENVKRQLACADELMNFGYSPYVPLLCHYQQLLYPRPYEDWLKHVMQWISHCDAMLRLPGFSLGADKEVELARKEGIPVYLSINNLLNDTPEW